MTGRHRVRWPRPLPALLLCWLGLLASTMVPAVPAVAAPAPAPTAAAPPDLPGGAVAPNGFVKYVVVGAAQGRVEHLWEVALRVLGDAERYLEIFALNKGRVQPDGVPVTDPAELRQGWLLVVPWDAVGAEVSYGPLPVFTPASPRASRRPRPTVPPASEVVCTVAPGRRIGGVPWAQLRLTPEVAWTRGRGANVTVAVIDSGVDGALPALDGRVRPGADATVDPTDGSRGDRDCTGHGTAMAGIVAASRQRGTDFVGLAPEATIVPVRIGRSAGTADSASLVTALRVATAAGAGVALIGASVDTTDKRVVAALRTAVARGTTVVVAARAATAPAGTTLPEGVLRVGAVGPDDRLAEVYRSGEVDVVAPGVDVVSLGIGSGEVQGTGTDYAVAFVAGLVALVRASEPRLDAVAAAARVRATADGASTAAAGRPDPWYGWGMINPAAAVNATLAGPATTVQRRSPAGAIAVLATILTLATLTVGLRRRRRH
ncbi:S8 family serine peptidase [Micromonospora antibiotica]|uniref:S8 family serine peptidase n=1 Tax=Micromonospora antibiotica TaxID=2807623 RepID=A0ABS3V889_9ACTN|nr:S8 family serine peptidase [Micromonospora antibiotica]MBO4161825.1 S8 family serine peptidase [Micromonospora antibiotica]